MKPHAEFRVRFGERNGLGGMRRADEQTGAGQQAVRVSFGDRRVDGRVEPEIVGIDDQQLHEQSGAPGRSWPETP